MSDMPSKPETSMPAHIVDEYSRLAEMGMNTPWARVLDLIGDIRKQGVPIEVTYKGRNGGRQATIRFLDRTAPGDKQMVRLGDPHSIESMLKFLGDIISANGKKSV